LPSEEKRLSYATIGARDYRSSPERLDRDNAEEGLVMRGAFVEGIEQREVFHPSKLFRLTSTARCNSAGSVIAVAMPLT
jgi:phage-related baseplate assembly protein